MYAFVYSVLVLSYVGSGLAMGWSPVQAVLPTVYKIHNFRINCEWEQVREPNPSTKQFKQFVRIVTRKASTIIRRVLDRQLDLLDHKQLHTITIYTLYDSLLQPQLFSEDCCSARIFTRNSPSKKPWSSATWPSVYSLGTRPHRKLCLGIV
jgi:hypothetical protein